MLILHGAVPATRRETNGRRCNSNRQILLAPEVEVEDIFYEATVECFAQGSDGVVRDSIPAYRSWDFDVTAVEGCVHLWQGLGDTLVPPPTTKTVAERVPGAVWHPVEGGGHFIAIGEADQIFAGAADELGASRGVPRLKGDQWRAQQDPARKQR